MSRKLIYKHKLGLHYGRINNISLHIDLRAAVISSEDGLVSLVDVERFDIIRILKIGIPVVNALLLSYPYYMFFISCKGDKQLCYSLNGQYLDESNYENIHKIARICNINGYQERLVIKKKDCNYFSLLKLP